MKSYQAYSYLKESVDDVACSPRILDDASGYSDIPTLQASEKLDNESISRYSRQLILPEIGVSGKCSENMIIGSILIYDTRYGVMTWNLFS